jgi:type IV pilus assembly protein PilP
MMRLVVLPLLALVVTACGSSGQDELRQWMAEQKNQTRPKVDTISEPKQFKPESYTQGDAIEPFSNLKLTQALRRESNQTAANAALIAPELARRKEPLEAFPLDAFTLVGSLAKAGQPVALVRVDNLLYQVKLGNYLGLNYGRVEKISESEITLREIAQDATGEWNERAASLQLQEKSQERSK